MRARFAIDEVEEVEEQEAPLDARIEEFKNNSENMEVLSDFLNEVLLAAEKEVTQKQISQQESGERPARQAFNMSELKNGKVINRARGLVVRLFDAICNCANTAAAPAQRIRTKRASSAAAAANATATTKQ